MTKAIGAYEYSKDTPEYTTAMLMSKHELERVYEKTEHAIFHIVELLNEFAVDNYKNLSKQQKVEYQDRYHWLACYLRHFRLGEDCLQIVKEVEVKILPDPYVEEHW